jgi:hypothetical protein
MVRASVAKVREFLGEYRLIARSMRLFAAAAPGHTAVMVVVSLLQHLLEPLSVWFMKFLVDAVVAQQVRAALTVA